jgi:hypothetical protein
MQVPVAELTLEPWASGRFDRDTHGACNRAAANELKTSREW